MKEKGNEEGTLSKCKLFKTIKIINYLPSLKFLAYYHTLLIFNSNLKFPYTYKNRIIKYEQ